MLEMCYYFSIAIREEPPVWWQSLSIPALKTWVVSVHNPWIIILASNLVLHCNTCHSSKVVSAVPLPDLDDYSDDLLYFINSYPEGEIISESA